MDVNCKGCAGCCIDWRSIASLQTTDAEEHRGQYQPLDDVSNFVVLTREDVRAFLAAGLADALTPRLFHAERNGITIDGIDLAALDGKPVFFVGLRKPHKPVAPFETTPAWLPTCIFLDPTTLRCRIHETELYPQDCAEYPGHNLVLDSPTECERVETAFGGERLRDATPPDTVSTLHLGPQALGEKLFVYPNPAELSGVVEHVSDGTIPQSKRALFIAAAAASTPGSLEINDDRYETALDRSQHAHSWVSEAIDDWASQAQQDPPDPTLADRIETKRGAPPTHEW